MLHKEGNCGELRQVMLIKINLFFFFAVVAQVLKKPHIAKSEDCAKEAANLKDNELTSTGVYCFNFIGIHIDLRAPDSKC